MKKIKICGICGEGIVKGNFCEFCIEEAEEMTERFPKEKKNKCFRSKEEKGLDR